MLSRERLQERFIEMIKIYSPSKGEKEMADWIENWLSERNIPFQSDNAGEAYGGNGRNIVAFVKGNTEERPLGFAAHMDQIEPCRNVNPVINGNIISTSKKLSGKVMGYLILIGLVVLSWLIFKILTPHNFGSFSNMLNYFQASLIATVGAVGFYFVMVMGMFDFSIGANIMLSAIVGCVFATRFNMGYFGLIIGCVLTGAIVGVLNGIFYVKLRIPSMIVTTGLALIYESVANYIAGGVEQTLPANIRAFGQMPWDIILALVACAVAYIFLNYTKIGTYTYAIGSDEFVAKNMGINVNKYKVLAFILSGAFLGVMAILTISYGSSMVAVTGMASMSRNFVPTMGCFFGLAFKKYGMPLPAIIIGEFVINIIFFGFIALGAPTAIQDVITGLALLIIITVTTKATKGEIVK